MLPFVETHIHITSGGSGLAAGSQSDHLLLVAAFDRWHLSLLGLTAAHTDVDTSSGAVTTADSQGGAGARHGKASSQGAAARKGGDTGGAARYARKVARELGMNEQVLRDLQVRLKGRVRHGLQCGAFVFIWRSRSTDMYTRRDCIVHHMGSCSLLVHMRPAQDMRLQLAGLLADVGLLPPQTPSQSGKPGAALPWLDDPQQPWNKYSSLQCVVGALQRV